ncbi:MAG: hypothetical protein V3W41_06490, partial [Planctomycetota bacterium]
SKSNRSGQSLDLGCIGMVKLLSPLSRFTSTVARAIEMSRGGIYRQRLRRWKKEGGRPPLTPEVFKGMDRMSIARINEAQNQASLKERGDKSPNCPRPTWLLTSHQQY